MPDQQPTIRDPVEVLADRLSALDETALRHFAYAMLYAPEANLALLRCKVSEAEEWSAKIATDFPAIFGYSNPIGHGDVSGVTITTKVRGGITMEAVQIDVTEAAQTAREDIWITPSGRANLSAHDGEIHVFTEPDITKDEKAEYGPVLRELFSDHGGPWSPCPEFNGEVGHVVFTRQ